MNNPDKQTAREIFGESPSVFDARMREMREKEHLSGQILILNCIERCAINVGNISSIADFFAIMLHTIKSNQKMYNKNQYMLIKKELYTLSHIRKPGLLLDAIVHKPLKDIVEQILSRQSSAKRPQ